MCASLPGPRLRTPRVGAGPGCSEGTLQPGSHPERRRVSDNEPIPKAVLHILFPSPQDHDPQPHFTDERPRPENFPSFATGSETGLTQGHQHRHLGWEQVRGSSQ